MRACIEHLGADVLCRVESGVPAEARLTGAPARVLLEGWAGRYDVAG